MLKVLYYGKRPLSGTGSIIWNDMSMWITAGNKDYQLTTVQLWFSPSQEHQCLSITILDDTILESEEDFQATLTTVMERVTLDPDTTMITIADDDSKYLNLACFHGSIFQWGLNINAVASMNLHHMLLLAMNLILLASHFDGCPFGQDGVWNISWVDTERGATDTQPCYGVDTIGIIISQTIITSA